MHRDPQALAAWKASFVDPPRAEVEGFILGLNRHLGTLRARAGLPWGSLSRFLKFKVRRAVGYVTEFENAVAREARRRGADGVVCGHIHHAGMHTHRRRALRQRRRLGREPHGNRRAPLRPAGDRDVAGVVVGIEHAASPSPAEATRVREPVAA